jgi:hypothetical protein
MKPVNINDLCDRRTAHRDNLRLLFKHSSNWVNDDIARGAFTIENLTKQVKEKIGTSLSVSDTARDLISNAPKNKNHPL